MEIVACISAFNAEATIARTLDSLKELVDRVIVVDGAWEGFADYPESKDATIQIAESYNGNPFTVTILRNTTGAPYRSEMEKRPKYLDPTLLKQGDYILYIDDDEFVCQGALQTRKVILATKETHHGAVVWTKVEDGKWNRMGEYVRLIQYVPGMKYGVNPWTVELPTGTSIPMKGTPTPLHIANDSLAKPLEYREQKEKARENGHFGNVDKNEKVKKTATRSKRKRKTISSQPSST